MNNRELLKVANKLANKYFSKTAQAVQEVDTSSLVNTQSFSVIKKIIVSVINQINSGIVDLTNDPNTTRNYTIRVSAEINKAMGQFYASGNNSVNVEIGVSAKDPTLFIERLRPKIDEIEKLVVSAFEEIGVAGVPQNIINVNIIKL